MKIWEIYSRFYGLQLSLLDNGDIRVIATRKQDAQTLPAYLNWLRENKAHVVQRLRKEGWK